MNRIVAPGLIAAVLVSGISATALAAPGDPVREIEVTMDLEAVTNPAAAARYATIATDLQGAIAARVADRVADDGVRLTIDLSEVELANSFTDAVGAADTRLVGDVNIYSETAVNMPMAYQLSVDVNQAAGFFPETLDRATLVASSDDFYRAMIAAFADGVVRRLDETAGG